MIMPTRQCDGCGQPIVLAQARVRPIVLDYPAHVEGIYRLWPVPDQPIQAKLLTTAQRFGMQGKLYRKHECTRRRK